MRSVLEPLTAVETLEENVDGVRGLTGATGVAVSQNGQYVYVTSSQGSTLAVFGLQANGTLVLDQELGGTAGLDQPSAVAVDPASGDVYVASQAGFGSGGGGFSTFIPAVSQVPFSLSLEYTSMQTVNVELGNSDNTLAETHYATTGTGSTTAAHLNVTTGNGESTINLLDIGGTTSVTTGTGSNNVTLAARPTPTPP